MTTTPTAEFSHPIGAATPEPLSGVHVHRLLFVRDDPFGEVTPLSEVANHLGISLAEAGQLVLDALKDDD